jgi:ketosteroid isomerase-like protein
MLRDMPTREANLDLVRRFWDTLYRRDFAGVGAFFADDGTYVDVPTAQAGAVGPRGVAARLEFGLGKTEKHVHHLRHMVCDGDVVITEHQEDWHFPTGEVVELPFVSVHEIRADGKIAAWRDYWDLQTLLGRAPQWWLEHLATAKPEEWR